MFHGGTNLGFQNGANVLEGIWPYYVPTVTSYGKKVLFVIYHSNHES